MEGGLSPGDASHSSLNKARFGNDVLTDSGLSFPDRWGGSLGHSVALAP